MTDVVKMAIEALRPFAEIVEDVKESASGLQNDRDDFFLTQIGGYKVADLFTDDFVRAAQALAALEQAGEPVAVTELDDRNEGMVCTGCGTTKTIAFIKASSPTAFTCCPERKMIPVRDAIKAAEAHAGELKPVAYRFVHLDYAGRKVSRYGSHPERVNGHDPIETHPLYAHPPQSRGQAFDGEGEADSSKTCLTCNGFGLARGGACWNCKGSGKERGEAVHPDTARLDALRDECWDLRCFSVPTGGDDADVAWKVVGHWMAEPQERTIAEGWSHDPRVAIDAALSEAREAGDSLAAGDRV